MAGRRYKGRHARSARPQLSLAGNPDDVARTQEFTAAQPDVVISFANGIYTARRDGEEIGRATRLGVLLSDLEAWARTQWPAVGQRLPGDTPTYVNINDEIQSEVSLPREMPGDQITAWEHRILIPTIDPSSGPEVQGGEEEPPSYDFDIVRK